MCVCVCVTSVITSFVFKFLKTVAAGRLSSNLQRLKESVRGKYDKGIRDMKKRQNKRKEEKGEVVKITEDY